jgi:hypothetical protein
MNSFLKRIALPAVILFALVGSSYAIPTISLSDGITTVIVADGSALDSSPLPGMATWSGNLGVWFLNVTTGTSGGTTANPTMDIKSVNASSIAGGTMVVYFSDIGFGPSLGVVGVATGGTSAGTFQFATYSDVGNGLFTMTTPLTSQSFGVGAFSSDVSANFASPAPYSLTEVATITHAAGGVTSFNSSFHVPDGGSTFMLLGFAFSGLALLQLQMKRPG